MTNEATPEYSREAFERDQMGQTGTYLAEISSLRSQLEAANKDADRARAWLDSQLPCGKTGHSAVMGRTYADGSKGCVLCDLAESETRMKALREEKP